MTDVISITLSRSQVNQVLLQARQEEGVAGALSGLTDHARLAEAYRSIDKDGPLISRSLLTGLIVFSCFPEDGRTLGINELAGILGLGTSTTFRYVTTLVAAGLLERDPKTRRYYRAAAKPQGHRSEDRALQRIGS
jgi:DNA-binding MarR family transcriptional regulator